MHAAERGGEVASCRRPAGRRPARQCDDPPTTARILGTGPKLSHIRTYRVHLDRGSGGQTEQDSSPAVIALQPTVEILRRAQAVDSVPNPTARSASRSVERPRPGFLFGQKRVPFPRGRQGEPGVPESRFPVPRGGGARLRGSRRAAFAGA